ncbi:serine/threonine-protein kinase 25, partial [Aphelenchoides avenae]
AGVIHRDLKSANVLVNERAEVKIADFGVSTDERVAFNCRGTHGWEAPEVVAAALTGITGLRSAYTQKADVYSVGVLAIDCFLPRETLPTDFFHKTKVESEFFAETQLQRIEEDRRLQLSDAFKTLVSHCVKPVQKRLSAAAVQKIPAVKKASVEPFKLVVAECLKKQKGKEDKRSARRQEPAIDTDTSSLPSSPKHRSGLATASTAEHQPSTSAGTSDLSSAAPARTRNGHSTANTTAVTNIFPSSEHRSQQASTSGGMPSLFFSTASALDY